MLRILITDADPEPDPAFYFNADPDTDPTSQSYVDTDPNPTFQFDANPDLDPTTHFFHIWTLQCSKMAL